jgi:hypothetical protein
MINYVLLLIGASLAIFWVLVIIFPTKNIVRDFREISQDNKYIITMEWLIEGFFNIYWYPCVNSDIF